MQPMRRDANANRTSYRSELFGIIRERSFGRGKVKLASGRESDFYFDLKPTMLHPAGGAFIAELILDALEGMAVDYIGGLEMGAVPLASAAAAASHWRGRPIAATFVRKRPKDHGAQKLVEGLMKTESLNGKSVVILEDVTTTGGSAIQAAEAIKAEGGKVMLVLSVVDRLEGAAEAFAAAGLPFRALFTAEEFLRA
jgi:orotate phosphoribosyltransferase